MNRFFVSESAIRAGRVVLGKEQAHQICHVLRMARGDRIVVLDNCGYEYDVALSDVGKQQITGRVMEKRAACGEPGVQITLYQSLLARDKFEWVLQKCTEVGVTRFMPVVTGRTKVRDTDSVGPSKIERWRRIITAAAEQACRGRIPELAPAAEFDALLSGFHDYDCCLMGATLGEQAKLRDALSTRSKKPATVALLIGPEGGFTEEETRLARAAGAVPISLGPRVLRTETAAVVASAVILYVLGQMENS